MRVPSRPVVARILLTMILVGILVFLISQLVTTNNPAKDKIPGAKPITTSQRQPADKSKPAPTQQPQPQVAKPNTPPNTPPSTSVPAPNPGTPVPNRGTPAPGTAGSPGTAGPTATGQKLTNSGPGSVVALFIGTAVVSALLHHRFIVSRRLTAHG